MYFPVEFDKQIAKEVSALVKQAYTQYDYFKNRHEWNLEGNYTNLGEFSARPEEIFSTLEPFGFVAKNNASSNVFVVIRGTQSLEDWLSDLTFNQVKHTWGNVEKGFYKLYVQCSNDILNAVKSAGDGADVFVTGHSLGAGLAVLATADLVISNIAHAPTMYSFAGPRVGDIEFAKEFNKTIQQRAWRIVNTEDIVTTVPLASSVLFSSEAPHTPLGIILMMAKQLYYEHIGNAVSFTTNIGSIPANHSMDVYIEAIQ